MTSTIKVNTVKDTASTDIIKKCGTSITVGTASDTTTVAGNAVRSNALQASDGQNIISQTGTTITLGASGDTIALSAGANQTGFGRTGTVDWQTGSIKTSTFTATSGEGYFVNTTGGAITVNLPAGVAGAIVGLKDYAGTWNSNAVTLNPNGSDKIGGGTDSDPTLEVNGGAVLLVFVDSTQGWLTTQESVTESPSGIQTFVTATGGTITTSGDCKVHTFTGPGTFAVSQIATSAANNIMSHVVIAGGGGGGFQRGGGAGAGGFREVKNPVTPYTASPLDGYCTPANRVTVTATSFPIVVGGGGAAGGSPNLRGSSGGISTFSTVTSAGGGGGGSGPTGETGASGGSGGGGGAIENPNPGSGTNGSGNTPPVSPPQGNNGAPSGPGPTSGGETGAGGGGSGAVGTSNPSPSLAGNGGAGVTSSINGTPTQRGGGGGGGNGASTGCNGGAGGGGRGGGKPGVQPYNSCAVAGTVNTGGGGGGSGDSSGGAKAGGSGVVIIRYKFQ